MTSSAKRGANPYVAGAPSGLQILPGSAALMHDFYVKVGDSVTFAKTVAETDIYLFAGITGDFSVNHVNEQYMARTKYGRRIAHGALIIGYMSTCSTMMIDKW